MKAYINKSRRRFLSGLAASTASIILWPAISWTKSSPVLTKKIPSSGESIPVVGLGTSRTFNVGDDPVARNACVEVMRNFFDAGGTLIDSSPMYGSSQEVIGYGLKKLKMYDEVFAADKVWTGSGEDGPEQMEQSRRRWGIRHFDLMQVHNLVAWEAHLPTLYGMKQNGKIRYVGITTSHGRRHTEFEKVMRNRDLDFIQLSYNIMDRVAEQRLLPLAKERGIAVIINRPFMRGDLIDRLESYPLPGFASEIGCKNWPQYLLKFIVSHPAVTCAIPATTRVDHVLQNMGAARGELPDAALREKMIAYVEQL